jgi:hypothetical protein
MSFKPPIVSAILARQSGERSKLKKTQKRLATAFPETSFLFSSIPHLLRRARRLGIEPKEKREEEMPRTFLSTLPVCTSLRLALPLNI